MNIRIVILLGIAVMGLISQYIPLPAKDEPALETQQVQVTEVIDGDTIRVSYLGKEETIRLIGIDTPEVDPNRGGPECYGKEASAYATSILRNATITLEADGSQGDRDTYGRLLRYVILADGTNMNQQLLQNGYAKEFTYDTPYRYQKEFIEAEITAKRASVGVWSCQ